MQGNINYIYDSSGKLEYAVVPIHIWEELQLLLQKTDLPDSTPPFDPQQYWGCLSIEETEIDRELLQMRQEWDRNF